MWEEDRQKLFLSINWKMEQPKKKKKKSCLVSGPYSITVSVVLHFFFETSFIEHEKKESFPFETVEVLVSRCLI